MTSAKCLNCGFPEMSVFYEVANVPVHSVLLMRTREAAVNYPTGDIRLGLCRSCGFIANIDFDPKTQEYSSGYEATQAYSPTFNAFHHRLAQRLIERYELHDKDIIEIGCGQGEFLLLLCELGGNRGVGFDPAYDDSRLELGDRNRTLFVNDFYSEKYSNYHGDFVCCKMTLEHIANTADFVSTIRRSIGDQLDTIVFFQVPSVLRILRELAFWDIYYEHCSYFSTASLLYLFHSSGFEVIEVTEEYGSQYLMIEARPTDLGGRVRWDHKDNLVAELMQEVAFFSRSHQAKLQHWRDTIREIKEKEQRAVIWGSGSKGVAFLTTLKVQDEIGYTVDINPFKSGTYMAGTGHEIVSPEFLRAYQPDIVIIMNPNYYREIQREISRLELPSRLITV